MTSDTDDDGNTLTVTESAWKQVMTEWEAGIKDGTISADDDRAKMFNAIKAASIVEGGADLYSLSMTDGVTTQKVLGSDFEHIIDETKVDEQIAELLESDAVKKDLKDARIDALGKVEGGEQLVKDLKEMAFGSDYVKYIQELSKDPEMAQVAQDDINSTYVSLLAIDEEAAAEFAQNMQLDAMTMELDALMADPSKISEENLTQAGHDVGKMLLTLIKKGGLDLGRRAAEAQKFLEGMLANKKTSKEFAQALQELGATYAKTGEVTTKDVEKVLGNGKYSSLAKDSVLGVFEGLTKAGIIGSLGGAVSLASAIYQLAGKGGTLADTPEERLAIAKDFIGFLGAGKHFADLANHIIGEHNLGVMKHNEKVKAQAKEPSSYLHNMSDIDFALKKPTNQLLGMDRTLHDLMGSPTGPVHGPNTDVGKFEAAFEEALNNSSKSDIYKNDILNLTDDEYGKLVKGIEKGYNPRPELIGTDGKPVPGWQKGASAALLVMSAGADTFAGAADIAIGALTIEKGLASGNDTTVAKGAIQVAAGGFGLAGGVASGMALLKGLQFVKAVAGPSFLISAILSIATIAPDIINDVKKTEAIEGHRDEMREFIMQLEEQGLLTEDGLDNYRFIEAYIRSYGQRDTPDGISVFDYRSDEVDYFMDYWNGKDGKAAQERGQFTSSFGLDQDGHEDFSGDGSNLQTQLDK